MNMELHIVLYMLAVSTIPQAVACLYFNLNFWGIASERTFRRIATFSLLSALLIGISFLFVPLTLRIIVNFAICSSLLFFVFRDLGIAQKMQLAITQFFLYIAAEGIVSYLLVTFGTHDGSSLIADPRYFIHYLLVTHVLFGALGFWMHRKRLAPGKAIESVLLQAKNLFITGLIVLFLVNVFLAFIGYGLALDDEPFNSAFLVFVNSLFNLILFALIIRSLSATKNKQILKTQETYIEEINNLFTTIRGQRHDFLNHVQVIQSFVQQGKTKELERYVSELVGEIVEINDLLQIGHPALAALVKSKMVYAIDRKIDFRYRFEGMERVGNGVASVDYVKIAGNLLDNALDEAMRHPPEERWIDIEGWTDDHYLYLSVSNPAKPLSDEEKGKLFLPGYTTKSGKTHAGLGLSIVKERVAYYRGDLNVESGPDKVLSFQVKLPLHMRMVAQ